MIDTKRQVRRRAGGSDATPDALRIRNGDRSLRLIHKDDTGNHEKRHHSKDDIVEEIIRTLPKCIQKPHKNARYARHNTGKDHNRDTVSQSLLRNEFPKPHEENSPCCCDNHHGRRIKSGDISQNSLRSQKRYHAKCLNNRERNGKPPRHHVELLPPSLALLLVDLLQTRNDRRQKLHDNRRRNIRRNAQKHNGDARYSSARKNIQKPKKLIFIKESLQLQNINTGQWNHCGNPIRHECSENKQNFVAYFPLGKNALECRVHSFCVPDVTDLLTPHYCPLKQSTSQALFSRPTSQ